MCVLSRYIIIVIRIEYQQKKKRIYKMPTCVTDIIPQVPLTISDMDISVLENF